MLTSFMDTTHKHPNYVSPAANLNWQTFTIAFLIGDLYMPLVSLMLAVLHCFDIK